MIGGRIPTQRTLATLVAAFVAIGIWLRVDYVLNPPIHYIDGKDAPDPGPGEHLGWLPGFAHDLQDYYDVEGRFPADLGTLAAFDARTSEGLEWHRRYGFTLEYWCTDDRTSWALVSVEEGIDISQMTRDEKLFQFRYLYWTGEGEFEYKGAICVTYDDYAYPLWFERREERKRIMRDRHTK